MLTCIDMRLQIVWQAWYFVYIRYFQDESIIALRLLNVWQAWYFGDPECRLCGLLWVRYSWEFRNRTFGPRRLPARDSVNLIGNRLVRTHMSWRAPAHLKIEHLASGSSQLENR